MTPAELAALEAAATSGTWTAIGASLSGGVPYKTGWAVNLLGRNAAADAALIAALRNAAPDLIAATRERDTLAGQVATLRAWIATECMPDAEWACEGHNWNMSEEDRERGQALLADTAAAAAAHDERMRAEAERVVVNQWKADRIVAYDEGHSDAIRAERERITEAVTNRPVPHFLDDPRPDTFMSIAAVLAIANPAEAHRQADHCVCGQYVSDPSGDAGCGNCGADEAPDDAC